MMAHMLQIVIITSGPDSLADVKAQRDTEDAQAIEGAAGLSGSCNISVLSSDTPDNLSVARSEKLCAIALRGSGLRQSGNADADARSRGCGCGCGAADNVPFGSADENLKGDLETPMSNEPSQPSVGTNFESLLRENRVFPPPAEFAAKAHDSQRGRV